MSNVISLVKKQQDKLSEINESFNEHIKDKNCIPLKAYLVITISSDGDVQYDNSWATNASAYALLGALEVVKDNIINNDFNDD